MLRILEHDGGLQIIGAVQAAGEPEMTGEIRSGLLKDLENMACFLVFHG